MKASRTDGRRSRDHVLTGRTIRVPDICPPLLLEGDLDFSYVSGEWLACYEGQVSNYQLSPSKRLRTRGLTSGRVHSRAAYFSVPDKYTLSACDRRHVLFGSGLDRQAVN